MIPKAEEILQHLTTIATQSMAFALFIRLTLLGLLAVSVARRRVLVEYLAGYVGFVLVAASIAAIGYYDKTTNLFTFVVLFPLGLLWGREALVSPPRPRPGALRIAVASALGLFAFFYPHFVKPPWEVLAFAPLGIVPCPTLALALAAVILTKRSYTLYGVLPTWIVAAFYGVVGVFYLEVGVDWALLAAVAVSVVFYLAGKSDDTRRKGKRFKRKR